MVPHHQLNHFEVLPIFVCVLDIWCISANITFRPWIFSSWATKQSGLLLYVHISLILKVMTCGHIDDLTHYLSFPMHQAPLMGILGGFKSSLTSSIFILYWHWTVSDSFVHHGLGRALSTFSDLMPLHHSWYVGLPLQDIHTAKWGFVSSHTRTITLCSVLANDSGFRNAYGLLKWGVFAMEPMHLPSFISEHLWSSEVLSLLMCLQHILATPGSTWL